MNVPPPGAAATTFRVVVDEGWVLPTALPEQVPPFSGCASESATHRRRPLIPLLFAIGQLNGMVSEAAWAQFVKEFDVAVLEPLRQIDRERTSLNNCTLVLAIATLGLGMFLGGICVVMAKYAEYKVRARPTKAIDYRPVRPSVSSCHSLLPPVRRRTRIDRMRSWAIFRTAWRA